MEEFAKRMTAEPHALKPWRLPDGQPCWIRELEYETIVEPWAKYALKDGGTLRYRNATSRIFEVYLRDPVTNEFAPLLQPNGQKSILTESVAQIVLSE